MVNLNLPGGWVVERLDGVALVERLGDPPDEKSAALEKVRAAAGAETEVLWATSTETIADQSYSSHLLVSLLPRHGLSLASYVSAVAAALTENEGVSVERTGIVYDVREDGLPLGILQYRFDAGKSEQETGGYQIVQFDANAHNLVVLTFTTSGSGLSEQIPVFHEIAASVHSGEVE